MRPPSGTRREGAADPAWVRADPLLAPYGPVIRRRLRQAEAMAQRLTGGALSLADFASGHTYFGLHRDGEGWVLREWAPAATAIFLVGECNGWREEPAWALTRLDEAGHWELRLPAGALAHGQRYLLRVHWPGGTGERVPAWARRVVQDPRTLLFDAQVWDPPAPYPWRHPGFRRPPGAPLIYETHVGMAQNEEKVGSYDEFRERILPRIAAAGYNTIQFMAIQEHPYYGSFGYHVSSYFAVSSRFGTPESFKRLVDAAHGAGLAVVMDLVHAHAARNEREGLSRFDGTLHQYFHAGPRGLHPAWDSRCFDYGRPEVLHFLLSNCRFWLDEYRLDGFRFDGVTSMLYLDHGLGRTFSGYADYFGDGVDEAAAVYLALANRVVHAVRPDAITIAEEVSGMPGLAVPAAAGGCGFDYRLAMGVPDHWIQLVKEVPDEQWPLGHLFYELTNRRADERTIGYVESHDQAIVGDQTLIFRLIGAEMYTHMSVFAASLTVDRGIALHKLIRLITLATAGHGYLNFMGNEFGHPDWIDFPREGNGWSHAHARRQWHLRDDTTLRYRFLAEFDRAMLALASERRLLETPPPSLLLERQAEKLLGFSRGGCVFLFNFHPDRSLTDWPVPLPPGSYRLLLDSDAAPFGGFGRIAAGQRYFTRPAPEAGGPGHAATVYLPARTALVLAAEG